MLKGQLLHPQITAALARAGHGSRVLISDGNYPHWTTRGPNAEVVFLNLSPGIASCTDVLRAVAQAVPLEAGAVMATPGSGSGMVGGEPAIWAEFRAILAEAGAELELERLERFAFYAAAARPDVALTVATGEERIYANLLLTIGVVQPTS